MMRAKVVSIIDGYSFRIKPRWSWQGRTGDEIRVAGYDAPEKGHPEYEKARLKLRKLVFGKTVELDAIKFSYHRLLCDVYVNGEILADYFPKYQ